MYNRGNSMGLYLNPGNDAFRMAIHDDIYVDKTDLIAYTNSKLLKLPTLFRVPYLEKTSTFIRKKCFSIS